jgi:hypothetical protein
MWRCRGVRHAYVLAAKRATPEGVRSSTVHIPWLFRAGDPLARTEAESIPLVVPGGMWCRGQFWLRAATRAAGRLRTALQCTVARLLE